MEFFILLLVCSIACLGTAEEEACGGKPADVVFLLDSSASIGKQNFLEQIRFTHDVVDMFDISPQKTRVGIVLFSTDVIPIFGLKAFSDKEGMEDAIDNIDYITGGTHTDKALKYVREKEFMVNARPEIPSIVILLTDGQSQNTSNTLEQAALAHAEGIIIFVIGIGGSVDKRELSALASDPDSSYLFNINSYSALQTIKKKLAIQTCKVEYVEPTPPPQADQTVDAKDCVLNLVIGVDSNGVSTRKSRNMLSFLSDVTDAASNRPGKLRTSQIMTQCAEANRRIRTKSYAPLIKNMRFQAPTRSKTNTAVGLLIVNSEIGDLAKASNEARRGGHKGFNLVVVSIGRRASDRDLARLLGISSNSKTFSQQVIQVRSYRMLNSIEDTVQHILSKFGTCQ